MRRRSASVVGARSRRSPSGRVSAMRSGVPCASEPKAATRAASSQFLLPRSRVVDVIERIKSQLSANPVVLYMKGTPDFPQCGFSAAAVRALSAAGAQFAHVNIFEDPELREALKQYSNWPTYPQLYVNGELIGGSDIILEMYKSGELQKLVSTQ